MTTKEMLDQYAKILEHHRKREEERNGVLREMKEKEHDHQTWTDAILTIFIGRRKGLKL